MTDQQLASLIIVAVIVMLILVISLVLFFNFSQKKILKEQELNHEQKMNFQKEMLENTIRTQEDERSRISRELHDDISSKLNVINMNLNLIRMKEKDEEVKKVIKSINDALGTAIERTRNISHELMPPVIEKFGLPSAIIALRDQVNTTNEIKMTTSSEELLDYNDGHKKLHIFRIIQELINNTLKHARASMIELNIHRDENEIILEYKDDGIGLPDDYDVRRGIGMSNIDSRVQLLNATVSRPNVKKGVCYKILIPNEK